MSTAPTFRRVAGVPSAASAVAQAQGRQPNIREVIETYIAATRAFVENAAATGESVGDIANGLPDSWGAFRFVLSAAIGGQRARMSSGR